MKALIACLTTAVLVIVAHAEAPPCDRGATTILIVRHAEKPGKADSLSAAGFARAKALVHAAGGADLKAIYHSDTNRARLTAEPLAKSLGITPAVYAAKEAEALVASIFSEHEGEAVLVVGHSNTVARIVAAAGGPQIEDLSENEFDKLFIVTTAPCRHGPSTLVVLQYGEPSP
jgi:broad specificity phosphatase PhoE